MRYTSELPGWDDAFVVSRRTPHAEPDVWQGHGYVIEDEPAMSGGVEKTATVFLAGRECAFRCVMCDLWKYTTAAPTPAGAIPAQLNRLMADIADVKTVKLYNAGNFFDAKAVPPSDLAEIASLVAPFDTVLVECHPRMINERVLRFRDMLRGRLQVAMGLETIHPEVLPRLNKRMTLADYERATRFLVAEGIDVRAFVLVRPPLLDDDEGCEWAVKSVRWARSVGVECSVLIPTRAGNGALDELARLGLFSPPSLSSVEAAMADLLSSSPLPPAGGRGEEQPRTPPGRLLVDLWETPATTRCPRCRPARLARLHEMNLAQHLLPPITCDCGEPR